MSGRLVSRVPSLVSRGGAAPERGLSCANTKEKPGSVENLRVGLREVVAYLARLAMIRNERHWGTRAPGFWPRTLVFLPALNPVGSHVYRLRNLA